MKRSVILLLSATAVLAVVLAGYFLLGRHYHRRLSIESVSRASLLILVDNNPDGAGLRTAWGLAVLVDIDGFLVLFDTGPDPDVLLHNARVLGVDLSSVKAVVLSHAHTDHVGGLPAIAFSAPNVPVYIPAGSPELEDYVRSLGMKPVVVRGAARVTRGVWVLGPLRGPPPEQFLVINVEGQLIVVTGCAHPGIERIVEYAYEATGIPVRVVLGGFHLGGAPLERLKRIAATFIEHGVACVMPVHCSGDRARSYFSATLGSSYCDGHVGSRLVVSPSGITVSDRD